MLTYLKLVIIGIQVQRIGYACTSVIDTQLENVVHNSQRVEPFSLQIRISVNTWAASWLQASFAPLIHCYHAERQCTDQSFLMLLTLENSIHKHFTEYRFV